MRNWRPLDTNLLPPGQQAFQCGPLRVIVSKDSDRWHLSISRNDRYPTWDEIKAARYDLMPNDIYMAQILPPEKDFVNCHPNCFHLWEIPKSESPSPEYI